MNEQITASALRDTIAALLGIAPEAIGDDSNLIELGLDSITMMRVAGKWRRQGIEIGFAELVANPRVSAWEALLERRSRRQAEEPPRAPASELAVDENAPFELALMQHAYWVGRSQGQQLGGVAAHFYNEFDGAEVDPARLEAAVQQLIARHGMLRVQLLNDGRQQILPESRWPGLQVHDLRSLSVEAAAAALADLRRQLSHRNLDLAAGEIFDIQLSLLPDTLRRHGTRLHVNLDMVAADALSLRVLLGDLARFYAGAATELLPIGYSYPRYLAEREAQRAHQTRAAALLADQAYWRSRLPELPCAPQLPAAAFDAPLGATTVVRRHRWLSPDAVRTFEARARRHGLTPAMALAAVFAEALTAWSESPAFLLNLPLFDREPLHPDVGLLVGDFTSSILLAWDGSTAGSFVDRARHLQDRFHADAEHVGYSGVEVLRDLSRQRGEQVLAPVVYTSALGLGELFPAAVKDHFGTASWIISQGPQVWLDAQVTELDGGLLVNVDAREDAFAPGVLDALFAAYGALLERLLADEAHWLAPVPALLPDAQQQVRAAANATAGPISGRRLHDAFFELALLQPDAPALLWGTDGRMNYGELRQRAFSVAGHLQRQGVRPGDVVALHLPKGPDQVVAVLGVLAAGATYLPVGIDQPPLRRDRIFQAAGIACVLDALPTAAEPLPAPVRGKDSDLAYILYTSGSTGEPKGVEIPHVAAMNTIDDLNARLALGPDDRTLALSALEFDLSVYDLFAPLSVGGAVVCIDESTRRDAAVWVELLKRHRATVLNCVPALLDMTLTAAGDDRTQVALRAVLLGGDWVTLDLPGRLRQLAPACRFIALGGTTETAIHSTWCEVDQVEPHWKSVPYGVPLRNVQLRVVDPLGRDCPDFVPGELWIGGTGVARGYRGDPARTAQKFLDLDGQRWYRTGDRARYWPDGCVEFLGRADFQVKLRGHRIELGEIEAALGAWPGVAQAVAVVGNRGLVGVVTLADEAPELPEDGEFIDLRSHFGGLRDFLAERLPAVMVPDHLLRLARFPLTPNGKVDRKALLQAVNARGPQDAARTTPPANDLERRVAAAWSELLGVADIGREHNFFTLGGDSLLATRLVRRLRAEGLAAVKLAELFARPVLADFAATLQPGGNAPAQASVLPDLVADRANRFEPFPPTDVQRAYWLGRDENFVLGGVGCHFYREYDVPDLDLPRLESALNALIERHEMLRAVFDEQGRQRILPDVPWLAVEIRDGGADPALAHDTLRRECAHQVFDPQRWPLFSIRGVRAGRTTRLAISLDNLILDALSILNFYAELSALYAAPATTLPPIGLSFRDYLLQCGPTPQALADAQAYWQRQLPNLPPAPQLPLARLPEEVGRPVFTRHEGRIDAAPWARLLDRAARHGLTASTILLTTFAEVLSRWSSRPELTLNLTLFDRKEVHPDIYRVMGDFTSLTLLGYRPEAGDSWLARARRVQQELGEALDHRELSTIPLLRELARLKGETEVAMPVVFTSALGVPGGTAAPSGSLFSRQVWGLTQTPQVWLDHQVVEADGGIALNWDVVEALFPEGLVATMFNAYLQALLWLSTGDWGEPLPDLMPEAQRRVRAAVNATAGPAAEPWPRLGLHQAFFRLAAERPARIALRWGDDGRMTYGELAERALRVAGMLAEFGVERAEVVAVTLPKGPEQIAAVLGVLAAGAAYLPIGVDQPAARRDRMLQQAGVRVVVTGNDEQWPAAIRPCRFTQAMTAPPAPAPVAIDDQQLAYVIFTSGSTGEPKGVQITHRAAMNTVLDVNQRINITADDRVLAVSALDFDLSVYDLFGLLSAGGSLVLIEEESRRDARRWHALVRRHEVTLWNTVPALLDMLLIVGGPAEPKSDRLPLRVVMLSGDWVGLDLPGRLAAQCPGCRFIAMGGATEASIWSNWYEVEQVDPAWRSVPYGYPLRNQQFRVVDAFGRDCPDWVAGELWIGGAGVALGYRGAPELTARQFVGTPGDRWYRTGDLGRYWPDGTLEFLGRADNQVKIRGHRIELGEIESALQSCPGVRHAVALVLGQGAGRRLVAAVVPSAAELDPAAVREHAAAKLPTHMVPERVRVLPELPLSANGKVHCSALARQLETEATESAPTLEAPQGEWELRVAALWQELLGTASVGRQQTFFELGGDSLQATRFIETVRQRHGLDLPLRRLFTAPTLAQVAALLEAEQSAAAETEEGVL